MTHHRPDGSLADGYFCMTCGDPTDGLGHGNCVGNPKLVNALITANNRATKKGILYFRIKGDMAEVDCDPATEEAMKLFDRKREEVTPQMRKAAKRVLFIKLYSK